MKARAQALAPAVTAGAIGLLSVATLVLAWLNDSGVRGFLDENQANTWLSGVAFGTVAVLVLHQQPANRLGLVFTIAGISAGTCATSAEYATYTLRTEPGALPGADLAAWGGSVLWLPAFLLLLGAVPLLYPRGEIPSIRWRWPARLALAGGLVATVGIATTQLIVQDTYPEARNPFDLPIPDGAQAAIASAGFVVVIGVGVSAVCAIAVRIRRHANRSERAQDAWFVTSVGLALVFNLVPGLPLWAVFAGNAASVAALAVGIVRHRLFDIEVVLSRALVYAVLTAGALAGYLLVAVLLGTGLEAGLGPALGAAVAALLLASIRQRVQYAVDRLLYGRRHDPLAALTALGQRLAVVLDTDAVLPAIADTVRETLRLPYAAIWLTGEQAPAYTSGELPTRTATFPLTHTGEQVGELIVGLRGGESALSPADTRLLNAFARQAGVAAHGVRAARDLRRSRERVVAAREEERRRLRRDLHDGLGPALAGITLGLETAARTATRERSATGPVLSDLRDETAKCVEEVRRIVADLRPPALDDMGLLTALRRHADVLGRSSHAPVVEVSGTEPLPSLPAAVEVAAYRIASEAITNAIRHSGGRTCKVSVQLDGDLRLSVTDDGCGRPGQTPGVGLRSMRERAEELGGTCTVIFRKDAGTRVEAVLPMVSP